MKMQNRIAKLLTNNIHINRTIVLIGFIVLVFSSASFGLQSAQKMQTQSGKEFVLVQEEDNKQQVSLELDKVSLISALRMLAKQVQVGFSFQEYAIPDQTVTVSLSGVPVFEALDTLLEGTNMEAALSPGHD